MLTYKLKKYTDKIFAPFLNLLRRIGMTSNRATLISFLFTLLAAYAFYKGELLTGLVLAAIDFLFDSFDGALARMEVVHDKNFGFYLDFATDHIFRNVWYLALAAAGHISYPLAGLIILSSYAALLAGFIPHLLKLDYATWVPCWFGWLILPWLVFPADFLLYLLVALNIGAITVHITHVLYKYRKELF